MNEKRLQMMREGKVPTVLLKLGMPAIIGMMTSALYNIVDAYFVGGLGTSQMGAVSIVFPLMMIIIGLGLTFGSGAGSYISRLLGEANREQANRTASTALFTSLIIGTVFAGGILFSLDRVLITLGATETILPFARSYAVIFISGGILEIFNVCMNNIVISEGASKVTMTSMLLACWAEHCAGSHIYLYIRVWYKGSCHSYSNSADFCITFFPVVSSVQERGIKNISRVFYN